MARRRKYSRSTRSRTGRPGGPRGGSRGGNRGGPKRGASLTGLMGGGGGKVGGAGFSGLSSVAEGNFAAPSFTTHAGFIPPGLSLQDVLEIDPPGHIGPPGGGFFPHGVVPGGTTGGGGGGSVATSPDRFTGTHLGLPTSGGGGGGLTSFLGGAGGSGGGGTTGGRDGGGGGSVVPRPIRRLGGGPLSGSVGDNAPNPQNVFGPGSPIAQMGGGPLSNGGPLNGGMNNTPTELSGGNGGPQGGLKLGGLSPQEKAKRKAEWQASIQARQAAKREQQAAKHGGGPLSGSGPLNAPLSQQGLQQAANQGRGSGLEPIKDKQTQDPRQR